MQGRREEGGLKRSVDLESLPPGAFIEVSVPGGEGQEQRDSLGERSPRDLHGSSERSRAQWRGGALVKQCRRKGKPWKGWGHAASEGRVRARELSPGSRATFLVTQPVQQPSWAPRSPRPCAWFNAPPSPS